MKQNTDADVPEQRDKYADLAMEKAVRDYLQRQEDVETIEYKQWAEEKRAELEKLKNESAEERAERLALEHELRI